MKKYSAACCKRKHCYQFKVPNLVNIYNMLINMHSIHQPYMFAGFKALSSWHFAKRRHGGFSIGFKGAAVVTAVLVAAPLPITGLVVHSPTVISKEKVDHKHCRCYRNL